jgi:hypothetical protein
MEANEKKERKDRVEFSEEQQTHVDALIGRKFAELKKENSELTDKLDKAIKEGTGGQKEDLSAQTKKVVEERRSLKILTALTKHQIVDTDAAAKLLDDLTYLDNEGNAVGLDKNGNAQLDESGKPMQYDDYVIEYLKNHPFLVKGSPHVGGGSQGARGIRGSATSISRSQFATMSPTQKMKYVNEGGLVN